MCVYVRLCAFMCVYVRLSAFMMIISGEKKTTSIDILWKLSAFKRAYDDNIRRQTITYAATRQATTQNWIRGYSSLGIRLKSIACLKWRCHTRTCHSWPWHYAGRRSHSRPRPSRAAKAHFAKLLSTIGYAISSVDPAQVNCLARLSALMMIISGDRHKKEKTTSIDILWKLHNLKSSLMP